MSRDTILTDEDGNRYSYERIKTQGWLNGHVLGAEAIVDWLKNKAVDMFKAGRHDEAAKMQLLAVEAAKAVIPKLRNDAEVNGRAYPEMMTDKEIRAANGD